MIGFLLKGVLRDRSRSLFPVLVVTAGVAMTVFVHAWLNGYIEELLDSNARFQSGHLQVTTRAIVEQSEQISNELALLGVDSLKVWLETHYPELLWTPRIRFGGLLDIPDEDGETREQGPFVGMAVNLLDPESPEAHNLNLQKALVRGRLPAEQGEMLIADEFARRLGINLGETATIISSGIYGGMAMGNFTLVGTVRFGITALDRGAVVTDIRAAQKLLNMEDGATELLGFFKEGGYDEETAGQIALTFNETVGETADEFAPVMRPLHQQPELVDILKMMDTYSFVMIFVFVAAMSIVLWNAGLMGSLRRFGEIGVRLAIGERKGHLYASLIAESLIIGVIGSVIGTGLGLAAAYYLQQHGIDISFMLKNSSVMISNVLRAKILPTTYVIGLVPGLLATLIGSAIAGIGIFRRQTANLFKELEV